MKIALVVLLLAVVVAGAWAVVYLGPDVQFSDEELREFGFIPYPEPRDVGDFALADAAGGAFDAERLRGRWSFMFFGFANCPDICPITMTVLGKAERLLIDAGDEPFRGIMVTVDPERDTATLLAEYVQAFSSNFVGVDRFGAGHLHLRQELSRGVFEVVGGLGAWLRDEPFGAYRGGGPVGTALRQHQFPLRSHPTRNALPGPRQPSSNENVGRP